jgi:4'-phosphopantetheinyl transferase
MIIIKCVKKPDLITSDIYFTLITNISKEKQDKIKRFVRQDDAYRSLCADILIRTAICKKLAIMNRDIEFGVNEYGKPYLLNNNTLQFNVSHSRNWIVCAIDDQSVGIDIEKIKDVDLSIAKRFFSKKEWNELQKKTGDTKREYFFDLWTLKESYIKAIGIGLSKPLDSFTIDFNAIVPVVEDYEKKYNNFKYFCKLYHLSNEYKVAVCAQKNTFPLKINIMSFEELYNDFFQCI